MGLPNAGKSTFLSRSSNAKPKIAAYPFSTLEPIMGIAEINDTQIVIADIPGIIQGAHKNIGLGFRFLKHVERCKGLIYLIDGTEKDPVSTYELLRNELALYKNDLEEKDHFIVLTKADLISEAEAKEKCLLTQKNTGKVALSTGKHTKLDACLQIARELIEIHKKNDNAHRKYDPLATS
nr:GTPase [Neorickettsia helminthoeca]